MRVAVGFDHGGWTLRETILDVLADDGHEIVDLGPGTSESVDHPDYAIAVARAVAANEADLGILACGTGIGMVLAANKVSGAYAANVSEAYSARMAREHNAANIVAIGGRTVGPEIAIEIIRAFLGTDASDKDRYVRRRAKITALEQD